MVVGKNNRAFSLIELLVAIAIVAILAAIAIPQFMSYTKSSKEVYISKNSIVVQKLCVALETYYSDTDKYGNDGIYKIKWDSTGTKIEDTITTWLTSFEPQKFVDIQLTIKNNGQNFEFTLSPTPNGLYSGLQSVTVTDTECPK